MKIKEALIFKPLRNVKLKFKQQAFQTDSVLAIRDCFAGQPPSKGNKYAIDPGRGDAQGQATMEDVVGTGFANAPFGDARLTSS